MKHLLAHVVAGRAMDETQAAEAFELIMTGQAAPAQTGALLALLAARGPTEDELVGAARVMRAKVAPVPVPAGLRVIDTCGTGGLHSTLFNISTAAALVAAAAGRPAGLAVAKHGNRAVTSRCGSAQVLEALGVRLAVTPDVQARCLDEAGFCFCFAPAHHPAMKHAAPVRAELGFRTIFNLVGPLTNPAGARRQVVGVFDPALTEPVARVLARLGAEDAMVVHGWLSDGREAGVGELATTGPTRVSRIRAGRVETADLDARALGLPRADPAALAVADAAASAGVIRAVLAGRAAPTRDIVLLNAAAALVVGGVAADLAEGLARAAAAIDAGAAARTLDAVVRRTQSSGAE